MCLSLGTTNPQTTVWDWHPADQTGMDRTDRRQTERGTGTRDSGSGHGAREVRAKHSTRVHHDLNGGQVLRGLRLRARLVGGDQQQRGVHDRRAVQHRGHQNVVARAVDERHVPLQLKLPILPLELVRGCTWLREV